MTLFSAPRVRRESLVTRRPLQGVVAVVIEDDDDARDLIVTVLSSAGARVHDAADAVAGFDVLRDVRPAVMVSDIGLPGEDGLSLMRRVRALGAAEGGSIPAVALTAFSLPEMGSMALAAGFNEFMRKPLDGEALIGVLRTLLHTK